MDVVEPKIAAEWSRALDPSQNIKVERRNWVLVFLPTPAEAILDDMDYSRYVDMFLRACDRPWEEI